MKSEKLKQLHAFISEKGFIWGPSPEIYGGMAGFYEYGPLDYKHIFENLERVCKAEGIEYEENVLNELAMGAGGDMRAALNDLQLLTSNGKLETADLLGERKRTESIVNGILKIMKTKDAKIASEAFYDIDEDINKQMLWMEENIPKEYEGEDLANAMDCLSKADVFLGRIRRWQHWRFLIYATSHITSGVALSKKEKYKKFVQYKPTTKLLKLWIFNNKYAKRKAICEKIASKCHTSYKRALKDIFPYVSHMVKLGNWDLVKEFEFSEDEVNWIKKD